MFIFEDALIYPLSAPDIHMICSWEIKGVIDFNMNLI